MQNYRDYDALGLAGLVRTRQVKAEELLDEALARTAGVNPKINAVVYLREAKARAEIAAGLPEGPFTGVPWLLKDLYADLEGEPMSNGSRLWDGYVCTGTSELVARYRRAGLVIFGRSTSPELGLTPTTESVVHGDTRNPWKLTHSAGGSSGGAAAAVAAGILPAAHATDGGGSIRIPATACGLFGMKPTRGRNPVGPFTGEGWGGMSVGHAVTRSVRDSAAILDATAGPDLGAPYFAERPAHSYLSSLDTPVRKLRIAVQLSSWNGVDTHGDCIEAAEETAHLCEALGHEVEYAEVEFDREALGQATGTVIGTNIHTTVADRAAQLGIEIGPKDIEPGTMRMYEMGAHRTGAEYVRAIKTIHAVGRQVANWFEGYDVLLTPSLATPPIELGRLSLSREDTAGYVADVTRYVAFTSLFNATGQPAMTVPLHWNAEGLPVGTQFAGRYGDETTLFQLAKQLEEARPWFNRVPSL